MTNTLRELRKSRNETQLDVAVLLGLKTASAYSKKENGKVPISLDEATKLSDHFGVSLDVVSGRRQTICKNLKSS